MLQMSSANSHGPSTPCGATALHDMRAARGSVEAGLCDSARLHLLAPTELIEARATARLATRDRVARLAALLVRADAA
ncbi:MAG: hypothetical protein ACXW0Z_12510 [Gemmatirosa sp.]